MHHNHTLVEQRLDRVLRERLRPAVHVALAPLALSVWDVPGREGTPPSPDVALPGPGRSPEVVYQPFALGQAWGPAWGTTWFHITGTVPEDAMGERIELVVDLGWGDHSPGFQAEGLVYRPDGSVVKALNPRNSWIPVVERAEGGERIDLYIEAAANPMIQTSENPFVPTRYGEVSTSGEAPIYRIARADVARLDLGLWELVQDLEVLGSLLRELPESSARRAEITRAVERALDALDLFAPGATAAAARAELVEVFAAPANASAHRISAVGHAHIDSAWLWPIRETIRKVARTTANVTALLDTHPDFIYAMSSAQQFAWLSEHRPELAATVAEHVASGRFVPVGGMWVESDTNMPGSEAMARQFVQGKRYFLDAFGIETREVWLPDSFGYSPALPQLVALSRSRWFLTQKISWNQVNPFPHHTFLWEGIDGTRVFTHFPPVDTYNSELSGKELAHAAENFREDGYARTSLVPFGWGDGGGGPTREMIARARRTADLEGSPRVSMESPADFFAKAEAEYAEPPVWAGELYLELHRGTYTSQAKTKQGNRRNEHLLVEAELWCATAAVRAGFAYPYAQLDAAWKSVLTLQFHDILPGSSIAWVHREAIETHARVRVEMEEIIAGAQRALTGEGTRAITFNAAPHGRAGIPAFGAGDREEPLAAVHCREDDDGYTLDNGALRVVVDARGLVTSVVGADGRELIPAGGAANLLQIHPDFPVVWDAWDVDAYYRNTVVDLTDVVGITLVEDGSNGVGRVRVRRAFGSSRVVQDIILAAGGETVEFTTTVDWHEEEKFLKAAFDLDLHVLRASYETQYGHHERPTHENTSWEAMKFEVVAHRFVHLAEGSRGVAILNDSTYGHDVCRVARAGGGTSTTVRLSLLRAPRFPDPLTDQGEHVVRYALAPVASIDDAVRGGYALNVPERTVHGHAEVEPIVGISAGSAVVSAVKLADDGSGDLVVRVYEASGTRGGAEIVWGIDVRDVREVDLLERGFNAVADGPEGSPVPPSARPVTRGRATVLSLGPFQVVTLRAARV